MSLQLKLLLEVEAKKARAELKATEKAAEGVGKSARDMGRKGKAGAAGTKALGDSAGRAKTQVRQLSVAEVRAANSVGNMGAANQQTAAQVGNLTAKVNTLGVSLAAGQSPLQLAARQGTQLSQAIGSQGAAGAAGTLSASLLQIVSPVNLITIGAIAAGAAMIKWLRSAGPEAISLDDILDQLTTRVEGYTSAAELARSGTDKLESKFGSASETARQLLANLAGLERASAIEDMATAAASLVDEFGSLNRKLVTSATAFGTVITQFDETQSAIQNEFKLTQQQAESVTLALEAVSAAKTPDEAIAAATQFSDVLLAVFGSADKVPGALREGAIAAANLAKEGGKILTEDEARARVAEAVLATQREMLADLQREAQLAQAIAAFGSDSAQVANLRLAREREIFNQKVAQLEVSKELKDQLRAGFNQANPVRNPLAEWAVSAAEYAAERVKGNLADLASAQALLQQLNEENAIRAAILRHGEGSLEVAKLRQDAERRVFEEGQKTSNVAQELKDELRAAFEEGQRLALLDMASGIGAAATEAGRLADNLEAARGKNLDKLTGGNLDFFDPRNETGLGGVVQRDRRNPQSRLNRPRTNRSGGGASTAESEALNRLTQGLKDELAILRETDPVQKEMLQNREALKGATEQERQSIADLIAERNNEAIALENHRDAIDLFHSTTSSALDALSQKGGSLSDVFDNLATSIRRAALEAILFGNGPLSGLLGNSGSGGILGGIAKAVGSKLNLPALAVGGLIHGRGSGTSDDVLIRGSQGEFMVNAEATKQHRGLLELINAGGPIPGYARGGIVAPDFMRSSAANFGAAPATQIIIENRSSTPVTGEVEETVGPGGRRTTKFVLADAVGTAMKTRGGGASKVMRQQFGLKSQGALR